MQSQLANGSGSSTIIIGMLSTAVGGLFALFSWLWKMSLDRSYDRIKVLEAREHDDRIANTEALRSIQSSLASLLEIQRDRDRSR